MGLVKWPMWIAALLGAMLVLAGCGDDRFPDYSYKMTVHTGGQEFSSVRHVEVTEGSIVTRRVTGEAVIIDHPNGRTYFALLSRPENPDYAKFAAGMALRDHVGKAAAKSEMDKALDEYDDNRGYQDSFGDAAEFLQAMVKVEGAKDLPRTIPATRNRPPMQAWPMFVTFGNPKDPKTVRKVTPESIGVERITIAITDEDVTEGIEERLPSYGSGSGFDQWYKSLAFRDPRRLTKDAFLTGDER